MIVFHKPWILKYFAWTWVSLGILFAPRILEAQEHLGRGRVTGTVVDEKGMAIEGALILAESLQSTTKLDGKSDNKGRFVIAGFGTGVWRLTASKTGYLPSSADVEVRQLRSNAPIPFILKKAEGLVALQADKKSMEMIDIGNTFFNEGRYDESLKIFEDILSKHPDIYQLRVNIALAYLKKDALDKAQSEFEIVLADAAQANQGDYKNDKATAVRALSGLGEVALKKGDFELAQKHFAESLRISPEDEVSAYNVGEIFFSSEKPDEAIPYFELAIKIKSDWSRPYYRLGLVYLNKNDFPRALEYLNKFVEIDPSSPDVPTVKNIIATIEKMKKSGVS